MTTNEEILRGAIVRFLEGRRNYITDHQWIPYLCIHNVSENDYCVECTRKHFARALTLTEKKEAA